MPWWTDNLCYLLPLTVLMMPCLTAVCCPHTLTQGCSDRGGEGFISRGATVGGSGCDLDTVQPAAFLMGHFDHCHCLRPQPGLCCMPPTQTLDIRQTQHPKSAQLLTETSTADVTTEFFGIALQTTADVHKLMRTGDFCWLLVWRLELQLLSPPMTYTD